MKKHSKHHIIPRSRGGANLEENIDVVRSDWHRRFHELFSNELPHEQIRSLLEWNSKVIQHPTLEQILELTEGLIQERRFYIKKCIRGRLNGKKLRSKRRI